MHRKLSFILISALLLCSIVAASTFAQMAPPFQTKWGTRGTGDGEFLGPHGIATAPSGHVYVSEFHGHRVQKFTTNGVFVTKWGAFGGGDGQFNSAAGIAVDAAGDVYVSSYYTHSVQKFTSSGTFVARWGTNGTNDGQFQFPFGLAVDASGNILVADMLNGRIQKFTNTGTFLVQFGSMTEAHGVAVDGDGFIYATDAANHLVNKYASDGTLVMSWGGYGTGNGQLWYPSGIIVDGSAIVYVSELGNHRVQMFTTGGAYIDKWGSQGAGNGQFDGPQGLALHLNGAIYVSDSRNDRIQVFGEFAVPVNMEFFTVERLQEKAILRWRINDNRTDDLRFDVYRQAEGGRMVRISDFPISDQSGYEYVDRDAPATRTDYWVEEIDGDGNRYMHGPSSLAAASHSSFTLGPNHPNPFNPSTTIHFVLPEAGQTRLAIYDARGKLVRGLADESMAAGPHEMFWDGRNQAGEHVGTGVYFARLVQSDRQRTHKLLLLK